MTDPIQYRPLWFVSGWNGLAQVNLRILAESDDEARTAAWRLYPQLVIGPCLFACNVIDPERNRELLED